MDQDETKRKIWRVLRGVAASARKALEKHAATDDRPWLVPRLGPDEEGQVVLQVPHHALQGGAAPEEALTAPFVVMVQAAQQWAAVGGGELLSEAVETLDREAEKVAEAAAGALLEILELVPATDREAVAERLVKRLRLPLPRAEGEGYPADHPAREAQLGAAALRVVLASVPGLPTPDVWPAGLSAADVLRFAKDGGGLSTVEGGRFPREDQPPGVSVFLAQLHAVRLVSGVVPGSALACVLEAHREHQQERAAAVLVEKPPALVSPVHQSFGAFMRVVGKKHDHRIPCLPGLRPQQGIAEKTLKDAIRAASKASGTLTQRIVRSLIRWGTLAHAMGEGLPVLIEEEPDTGHRLLGWRTATGVELVADRGGGLSFFARAVGHPSNSNSVAGILDIFASHGARWETPRGRGAGPLITWKTDLGDRYSFAMHLGELLLPGIAGHDGDPLLPGESALIPVLSLPDLSGFNGRSHSVLCSLDWALMEAFVERRAELMQHGGVAINFAQVARTAGMGSRAIKSSTGTLAQAVDRWVARGEAAKDPRRLQPSARWVEVAPARYTLVPDGEEGAALEFIKNGMLRSLRSSERGKISARKRKGKNH